MKMKSTLFSLTIVLMSAIYAHAQVSEGFDYDPSGSIAGNGGADNGWSGPWSAVSEMDSSSLALGGVLNETLLVRSSSNRAQIVSTTAANRYRRYFDTPLEAVSGAEYWFSAHMAIDGNPAGNVGTLNFVDSTQGQDERITIGKRFGNRNVFATGPGSGPTNTGRFFEGTDARWVLGHLTFNDMSGNWELDLWVDPDPSAEPAEADAQIMNKAYPAATFHGINLKSEGAPGILYSVDDIMLGGAYADVVPDDLIIVPPLPPGAAEDVSYAAGDSLVGEEGGSGFDGEWIKLAGTSPIISEGGIESALLQKRTSGNVIQTLDLTRMVRSLEGEYGDFGRTFWVGWWFDTENQGPNISHLVLADENSFGAGGPDGRIVQIGSGFGASNIGIVGSGNTAANADEGHFLVAEIVTNGTSDNDLVYLYVDPDPEAQPDREDAALVAEKDLSAWNAIGLIVEGTVGVTAYYDDIQVGLDYGSVVSDDLEDIAPGVTAFAFDQFVYASGQDAGGNGAAENGWSGPWGSIDTNDVSAVIAEGGVSNDVLLVKTSANSYEGTSTGSQNRLARYFTSPLTRDANQTFWFSAHMAVNGDVGGNVGTMVLLDTAQDNNERVIIGKRFGNRNLFATGAGSGPTNSGAFFTNTSASWVVGRITANDTADNWILDMWVDADPGAGEPSKEEANIQDKIYPAATFHGVSLKAEGAAGLKYEFDDLFFGNTWEDVLPLDLDTIPPAGQGASEPFSYDTGVGLSGQAGGNGWADEWTLVADDDPSVGEAGITSLPLLKMTSSNHALFGSNGRLVRTMDGSYGDNGRTYWVGFWFDSDNGGPNVTNLVLADTAGFEGSAGELLQIGRSFNGSNIRFIGQGTSNASASEGHFVVLECVTNGTSAPDDVYMWIDPSLDRTPSRDTADVIGTANLTNWNAIGLKVAGDPGVTVMWDDIRIDRSYSGVVPTDLLDVPDPSEPIAAIESFEYDAGSTLGGQDGGQGFGGPWEIIAGDDPLIVANSIESDRIDGIGNKVDILQVAEVVTYERPYFARYASGDDGKSEIWMSFLLDVTENSIGNFGGVGISDGGTSLFHVGATAGLGNIAARYNGGESAVSVDADASGVNWIVIRMDLYGAGLEDTAYVWVNPSADALPDIADADITVDDLMIDDGFDRLVIEAGGAQDLNFFADEIYTGFSFRNVSPKFGSDDPNLLVYEPFNYDANESLFGQGGINAFWDGKWEDAGVFGENNELLITDGSIPVSDFETIGNKAEFAYVEDDTQIRADRKLAFPITSDGRVYWMSFFMNTTEGAAPDNVGNVTLRNTAIGQAGGQRLAVGRLFGQGTLGFVTPATNNNRRSEILDEGIHWMVVRIGTNAEAAVPDTIHMWIDPEPGEAPDTSTSVVDGISDFLKAGPIDVIRIRTEGAGGNQTPYITNFDELRIATTFQSASLSTSTDEPIPGDQFVLTAYPNPMRDLLNISFELENSGDVLIDLFDVQGSKVADIFQGQLDRGAHTVEWSQNHLSNGFYVMRITQEGKSSARQIIVYR